MGFLRGFSIAMGANALLFIVSLLNNKLLYLVLSKSDNGVYSYVMSYSILIALVFGEWIRLTNMNMVGSRPEKTPVIGTNTLVFTLIFGVVVSLGAAMLAAGDVRIGGMPAQFYVLVAVIGFSLILRSAFQSILLVQKKNAIYGTTLILWGLLILLINLGFALWSELTLPLTVLSLLISTVISALWAVGWSIRFFGLAVFPSVRLFVQSWRMGLKAMIAVVGMFTMSRVNLLAIAHLAESPEAGMLMAGVFSVCIRLQQLFQRASDVTGSVLLAHVASTPHDKGYRLTAVVCRNLLMFSTLGAIIAGLLGKVLIYIVADSDYFDAYIPLLIMLPGIVCMLTGAVLNGSYWGRGYPAKVIYASYIATAIGLAIQVIATPVMGIAAASLGYTIMSALWFAYIVLIFHHDTHIPFREILLPAMEDFRRLREVRVRR